MVRWDIERDSGTLFGALEAMSSASVPPQAFETGLKPADIDPQHPPVVESPWGTVAIYRADERLFAVEAFCPHLLGPLFAGSIVGTLVTCPWHLWRYDVATGERIDEGCPKSGPDARPLKRFEVELDAGGFVVLRGPAAS